MTCLWMPTNENQRPHRQKGEVREGGANARCIQCKRKLLFLGPKPCPLNHALNAKSRNVNIYFCRKSKMASDEPVSLGSVTGSCAKALVMPLAFNTKSRIPYSIRLAPI